MYFLHVFVTGGRSTFGICLICIYTYSCFIVYWKKLFFYLNFEQTLIYVVNNNFCLEISSSVFHVDICDWRRKSEQSAAAGNPLNLAVALPEGRMFCWNKIIWMLDGSFLLQNDSNFSRAIYCPSPVDRISRVYNVLLV